jgi:hypothetical protein
MSNIKITDKTKTKQSNTPTVGQYYRDRTSGDVFILARHDNSEQHSLICLRDGRPYSSDATQKPIGAFCGDEADFDLIDNVEIVLF